MRETILYDSLKLFVDKINTLETRLEHETNLTLNEQLKGHLRDKESWAGSHGVADGVEDVRSIETFKRLDRIESIGEGVVKDVADPGST